MERAEYPERKGEPPCQHYFKTGKCKFGMFCKYNHPKDAGGSMANVAVNSDGYPLRPGEKECPYYLSGKCEFGVACKFHHPQLGAEEYPEREGEPACQYYLKSGKCKFGVLCKYNHPKDAGGSLTTVPRNCDGYPLRPGEKECSYYLSTGKCNFGLVCKFHHPHPAGTTVTASARPFHPTDHALPTLSPEQYDSAIVTYKDASSLMLPGSYIPSITMTASAPTFYTILHSLPSPVQYYTSTISYSFARPSMLSGSYIPGHLHFIPGMVPLPDWNPSLGPNITAQPPIAQLSVGVPASVYGMTQICYSLSPAFTGLCAPYQVLSSAGPSGDTTKEQQCPEGAQACDFYMQKGQCMFGRMCWIDHPMPNPNYNPDSSYTEMPG